MTSEKDGEMTRMRLRSVSDQDEKVLLEWHDRKPVSIEINDLSKNAESKKVSGDIIVPARGFITLTVRW